MTSFQQLQQVHGLTVIPVNRVAQVFAGLQIARVQSPEQATLVCEQLGCDALVVPADDHDFHDPYDPPEKFGASLQIFCKGASCPDSERRTCMSCPAFGDAAPRAAPPPPAQLAGFKQSVGMYDAANGSVRELLADLRCRAERSERPAWAARVFAEHGSVLRICLSRVDSRPDVVDKKLDRLGICRLYTSLSGR